MINPHPILLGVNIDHVATIRQARGTLYPEVIQAALMAEQAGADSITAHLREDRRHIQDRDIEQLFQLLQTRLNLEMAVTDEMLDIACRLKPAACCLVPERREELTTEGGLDVVGQQERIRDACQALAAAGVEVSLFIAPDPQQIDAAAQAGAPVIELHTGHYADLRGAAQAEELRRLQQAAQQGKTLGLQVNAGHGLHYHNVEGICHIPNICELNIGHSIVSRALFTGLERAVRDMKELLLRGRAVVAVR